MIYLDSHMYIYTAGILVLDFAMPTLMLVTSQGTDQAVETRVSTSAAGMFA